MTSRQVTKRRVTREPGAVDGARTKRGKARSWAHFGKVLAVVTLSSAFTLSSAVGQAEPAHGATSNQPTTTTTEASAGPASASISVSPPTAELNIAPGQSATTKISLVNNADVARTFSVAVQNFRATGEEGQADLSTDDGPYSLQQWIKVTPSKVTIAPNNGHQDFQVTVQVPANAGPGGRFGAVVFTPEVAGGASGGNVSVVSQVSSLVLLRISGDATEKASIADFTTQTALTTADQKDVAKKQAFDQKGAKKRSFFQKGPVGFAVRIKNDGNVQVRPEITISVYNAFGSKVATLSPKPETVLPDSVRKFEATWDQGHVLGRYTTKVDVKYGTSNQVIHRSGSFWGAPLGTVAVGAGILIAVLLLVWLPRKRWKKAFKAMASGSPE